jgi:hypothetical protein
VLSTWLHTLATIVMIGYYVFTSLIYLPVFERQMQANALREILEQVSSRPARSAQSAHLSRDRLPPTAPWSCQHQIV